MNNQTLQKGLQTKILGHQITFFDETDSTNEQAKIIASQANITEGHIIVAAHQTQGKGTDGNVWETGNNNLALSIIFDNNDKVNTLFPLYPAVALAKVLRKHYNIEAHVKWPNDVLVGHRKIAGILCEGVAGKYMIVGIGLNVNSTNFSDSIKNIATSMQLECGVDFQIESVLNSFLKTYEELLYNTCDIRQEWLMLTKMTGKKITAIEHGKKQIVTVKGMTQEGFLTIETETGEIKNWMARRGLDIMMSDELRNSAFSTTDVSTLRISLFTDRQVFKVYQADKPT